MAQSQSDRSEPLSELTSFQRDVLAAVSQLDGEPSGQDIKALLEASGYDDIHHSRLYQSLPDLEERGLLDVWEVDGRTNGYGLTELGEARLMADLRWRVQEVR